MTRNRFTISILAAAFVLCGVNPSYALIRFLKELSGPGWFWGLDFYHTWSVAELKLKTEDLPRLTDKDLKTLQKYFDLELSKVVNPLSLRREGPSPSEQLSDEEQSAYLKEFTERFAGGEILGLDVPPDNVSSLEAMLYLLQLSPGLLQEEDARFQSLFDSNLELFKDTSLARQREAIFDPTNSALRTLLVRELQDQIEVFRRIFDDAAEFTSELDEFVRDNKQLFLGKSESPGGIEDLLSFLRQEETSMEVIHILKFQVLNMGLTRKINETELADVAGKFSGFKGVSVLGDKMAFPQLEGPSPKRSKKENPWYEVGIGIQHSVDNNLMYPPGTDQDKLGVWWITEYFSVGWRGPVNDAWSLYASLEAVGHQLAGEAFKPIWKFGPRARLGVATEFFHIGTEYNFFPWGGFSAADFGAIGGPLPGDQPVIGLFGGINVVRLFRGKP